MKGNRDSEECEQLEIPFLIKHTLQRFLDEKGNEENKTAVVLTSEKLNQEMSRICEDFGKEKYKQYVKLQEEYTKEYIRAGKDCADFIERETEQALRAELELEKDAVIKQRERLLQDTIKLTLEFKEKKGELSKLESANTELDEELSFLSNQQKFGEEQNALLEKKVQEMLADLKRLKPDTAELDLLQLIEVLPVALKKKEPEFPQLLDLRTRKNFYTTKDYFKQQDNMNQKLVSHGGTGGSNNGFQGLNSQHQEIKNDPYKKNLEELSQAYSFLTENKYVIEAIFENVLLENNMYKFPLSVISDTERKQLMEKVLANDEFKEYVYQKIIKSSDGLEEDRSEPIKKEHLISQAATHDEGANASLYNSSVINKEAQNKKSPQELS